MPDSCTSKDEPTVTFTDGQATVLGTGVIKVAEKSLDLEVDGKNVTIVVLNCIGSRNAVFPFLAAYGSDLDLLASMPMWTVANGEAVITTMTGNAQEISLDWSNERGPDGPQHIGSGTGQARLSLSNGEFKVLSKSTSFDPPSTDSPSPGSATASRPGTEAAASTVTGLLKALQKDDQSKVDELTTQQARNTLNCLLDDDGSRAMQAPKGEAFTDVMLKDITSTPIVDCYVGPPSKPGVYPLLKQLKLPRRVCLIPAQGKSFDYYFVFLSDGSMTQVEILGAAVD